jgi:hypothetical protein
MAKAYLDIEKTKYENNIAILSECEVDFCGHGTLLIGYINIEPFITFSRRISQNFGWLDDNS